ncbi:hypothetical protein [Mycoplasmopsis anatis]|uniref:hypothetical protein n=1 Tax=Mycoplasmopsis anatis TaxID=171279 RepID=UPI00101BD4C7|nr:hypothetical protein [Mycoplasmopsis anatis]
MKASIENSKYLVKFILKRLFTIKDVLWVLFLIIAGAFGSLFGFVSFKNRKLKKQLKIVLLNFSYLK